MNGWWIPMNRAFATVVALSADSGASLSLSPSWQCLGCVWKPEGPCSLCWVPHFLRQCSFARGNCSCCSVRGCFNSCNGKSVQSLLMWSLTWMFPDTLMHVLQTELVLLICLLHLKPCPLLGFPTPLTCSSQILRRPLWFLLFPLTSMIPSLMMSTSRIYFPSLHFSLSPFCLISSRQSQVCPNYFKGSLTCFLASFVLCPPTFPKAPTYPLPNGTPLSLQSAAKAILFLKNWI